MAKRTGTKLAVAASPPVAIEASANALRELCYEYAAAGRSQELTSLVDVATHIALSPFAAAGVRGC